MEAAIETYSVSEQDVKQFQEEGAVLLKNVFTIDWIDLIRQGIEENLKSPSPFGEWLKVHI